MRRLVCFILSVAILFSFTSCQPQESVNYDKSSTSAFTESSQSSQIEIGDDFSSRDNESNEAEEYDVFYIENLEPYAKVQVDEQYNLYYALLEGTSFRVNHLNEKESDISLEAIKLIKEGYREMKLVFEVRCEIEKTVSVRYSCKSSGCFPGFSTTKTVTVRKNEPQQVSFAIATGHSVAPSTWDRAEITAEDTKYIVDVLLW